ncbi:MULTISPECIES: DUF4157 domain-containing protein [unclassified Microcoleus]|uniref:eCIS core domain-containing protein n=1 Tax=unclassified Microcoleus TaxID=2642155 RepID=UPI002FD17C53
MLQAPISDRKTKAEASSRTLEHLPEQESGMARSHPLQQRDNLAALQKAYGNQAVLRMQQKERLFLQRKTKGGERGSEVSPIVHEVLSLPGQPLNSDTRTLMESSFAHDFSHVRLHTDARAAESAKSVDALAYTVGKHVVFGTGQYMPKTPAGQKLIAHELAHTIQQRAGNSAILTHPSIDNANNRSKQEVEASEAENYVTAGQPVSVNLSLSNNVILQRQTDSDQDEDSASTQAQDSTSQLENKSLDITFSQTNTLTGPVIPEWRIYASTSPGWASVTPVYWLISKGEPVELPHFLKVESSNVLRSPKKVQIVEGRYYGHEAVVPATSLVSATAANPKATAKFDISKGEFWYGGKGPISAMTQPDNPTPKGTHDIEIPDFHHDHGAKYGDFGTTWFRLGHSGDRYLHPGRVSLGCTTINQTSEWPQIWNYLISARKDNQSVGELEVV